MINSSNRNGIQLMNKSLALFMNTFILFYFVCSFLFKAWHSINDQLHFQSHRLTQNERKNLQNLNLKIILKFSSSVQGCRNTVKEVKSYKERVCKRRWWGFW